MSSYNIYHKDPIKYFLLRKKISIVRNEGNYTRIVEVSPSETFRGNVFKINFSHLQDTYLPSPKHVVACFDTLNKKLYWISEDALYNAFEELKSLDIGNTIITTKKSEGRDGGIHSFSCSVDAKTKLTYIGLKRTMKGNDSFFKINSDNYNFNEIHLSDSYDLNKQKSVIVNPDLFSFD